MPGRNRKKMAQLFSRQAGVLRSGDVLVDWFFRQFVSVLRSERVRVARKRRLINPDEPHRGVIRGLMDPDSHPSGELVQIFINPARNTHRNRNEEVETLMHELAHVVLPYANERQILAIEGIMAKRITPQQRRVLKAFLPRHEIKRYPLALA